MGKSTGPRTPQGKSRSSKNAAKHWIESQRILPDEQKEAASLRQGFADEFRPAGALEHELMDDLTLNRLIKRRIDAAYTREFSKAAVEKTIRLQENYERAAAQYWIRAAGLLGSYPAERLRPDLCVRGLEEVKRGIEDHGAQPNDLKLMRHFYGDQPTEHAASAIYYLAPKQVPTDEKQVKEVILVKLQEEIELQKQREELAETAYAIETASAVQEPDRLALETLERYRDSNMRELENILACLDRIRRLKGTAA